MSTKPLTFGMDVEFLLRKKRKDVAVPACGLFGGTKKEPLQVPYYPEGFMMQEDGASLELNCPPAKTVAEWAHHAHSLGGIAKDLAASVGLRISHSSQEYFGDAYPRRKKYLPMYVVGCDPDFDAFNGGDQRRVFQVEEFEGWRFAGGHIHVGYDTEELPPFMFARAMAQYLDWCHDFYSERSKFYGMSGIFRPKPYGVEYRSLSNFFCIEDSGVWGVAEALDRMRYDWEHDREKFMHYAAKMERPS